MQEKYLPRTTAGKIIHLVEECAEVQKALTKIQRFGFLAINPKTKITNIDKLYAETADLQRAWKRLQRDINRMQRTKNFSF